MCRVLLSLLLFSLLACSIAVDQTDDHNFAQVDARYGQLDARLRGMAGANERQLLVAMGRMPDTSYQVGDQTKVLQWWWDTSYTSPTWANPNCSPRRGMGGYSPSPVRESFCIVDWTVSKGTSQTYHWQGDGCRSVTLEHDSPWRLNGRDAF
jgi:hypothetical protein